MFGTVKSFNDEKGYGFILPDDGSKDCFVHYSAVRGSSPRSPVLSPRDRVEFTIVDTAKGPAAQNVTRLASVAHQSAPVGVRSNA